jgi:hypothetical protein
MSPKRKRGAPLLNKNATKHNGYGLNPQSSAADTSHRPTAIIGLDSTGAADTAAPAANKSIPSLQDIILDLVAHQKTLAQYIESQDCPDALAALNLYGQNSSRLARMVKMVGSVGGPDKIRQNAEAIYDAITAFGDEVGIRLGKD